MLEQSAEDADYQLDLLEACKRDVLFFVNAFCWTYDDRTDLKHLPFLTYPFQDAYFRKLNQHIIDQKDLLTDKSRDMGASWMLVTLFFWRWRFHNETFLIGSRKENLVDKPGDPTSHFERLRYIRRRLPLWMLPNGYNVRRHESYMKMQNPEFGNTITGEATNDNFSRQGRYRAIMLDEFAFVEHPEQIWRACGDSTNCRLPVSTPNGKQNYFGRLRFGNQVETTSLHWKWHPNKTDEWYEEQKIRRPPQDLAREVDLSYETSEGKPFYGDSYIADGPMAHFRDLVVPAPEGFDWVVMRGWDYGYHRPACVFTVLDTMDRWLWLYCIMGYDTLLDAFRDHVLQASSLLFPHSRFMDYGDYAGRQVSDKSEKTCEDILRDAGIDIVSRPNNDPEASYASRKKIIQGKLHYMIGALPGLMIHRGWEQFVPHGLTKRRGYEYGTRILHEAMKGGYAYPPIKENKPEDEKPNKEGYYEHPMNAVEYVAVNHFASGSAIDSVPSDFDNVAIY